MGGVEKSSRQAAEEMKAYLKYSMLYMISLKAKEKILWKRLCMKLLKCALHVSRTLNHHQGMHRCPFEPILHDSVTCCKIFLPTCQSHFEESDLYVCPFLPDFRVSSSVSLSKVYNLIQVRPLLLWFVLFTLQLAPSQISMLSGGQTSTATRV